MKQRIFLLLYVFICVCQLAGCSCEHEWTEANCANAKTCTLCGEVEGEPLDHSWQEASCAEPKSCLSCGKTEGEPLPHTWQDATCEVPKTCSVCGETEGELAEHKMSDPYELWDFLNGIVIQREFCVECYKYTQEGKEEKVTSFVTGGGKLALAPEATVERLNDIIRKTPEIDTIYWGTTNAGHFLINYAIDEAFVAGIKFYKEFEGWDNYQYLFAEETYLSEVGAIFFCVNKNSNFMDMLFNLMEPNRSLEEIESKKEQLQVLLSSNDFLSGLEMIMSDTNNHLCYDLEYLGWDQGVEFVGITVYPDRILSNLIAE